MMGQASGGMDWDVLAGKAGKYGAGLAGVVIGLLSLPMFAVQSPARLLVALGLGAAAFLALLSGRSLARRGDVTEGAARMLIGALAALAAVWFSNLVPSPTVVQASTVSGHMNDALRTVAQAPSRQALDRRLSWTVYPADGVAARLQAPLEGSLAAETAGRPLRPGARRASAGVRITGRAGTIAGGQVTAGVRVALAAEGAPQCVFAISIPRPMPLKAAADWLAQQAVVRAQAYVEGSDTC